jgi:hypothetical protein
VNIRGWFDHTKQHRFCTDCGHTLGWYKYEDGYDSYTGEKVVRERWRCPMLFHTTICCPSREVNPK